MDVVNQIKGSMPEQIFVPVINIIKSYLLKDYASQINQEIITRLTFLRKMESK